MKKAIALISIMLMIVMVVFVGMSCKTTATTTATKVESATTAASAKTYKIALVLKTLTNPFFIIIQDAAKQKANDLGVELLVQAPEQETDYEKQLAIVENMISSKVDAIVITLADAKALVPAIKKANDAGIIVITLNQRVDEAQLKNAGGFVDCYIGTDDRQAGQMCAEALCKAINNKGEIANLEGIAGNTVADDRNNGLKDIVSKYPEVKIVSSQPANWETEKGYSVTQNILQANPDIVGIFGDNDMMALGAIKAVEDAGLAGKIQIVGLDAIADAINAVKNGSMYATLTQHPELMGSLGIENAVKKLNGETIETDITTKNEVVDKSNVDKF